MGKYGQTKYGQTKYGFAIEYIFDRTEMDLIKGTAKAYINYEDLKRIKKGIKAISKNMEFLLYLKRIGSVNSRVIQ